MAKRPTVARKPKNRLEGRSIRVIGLGGIGAQVSQAMAQFLYARRANCTLWLIDGDAYEERNRDRVMFCEYDNKATAKARELAAACAGGLTILPVARYVTPRNVARLIQETDIVFLCVDNHATRKLVSDRCGRLNEAVLFSGGNDGIENGREGTYGNVQIFVREDGRHVTNPLTRFHPEIANPEDRRPDQAGCGALAQSAPQLLFTNMAVASAMLGGFYSWLGGRLEYEEAYLDIARGRLTPVKRGIEN